MGIGFGMGGGAAAAIAAVELYRGEQQTTAGATLAVVGGIIGAVSFSGSLIAFGKLQGLIRKSLRFGGQQLLNLLILAAALVLGAMVASGYNASPAVVTGLFVAALVLGLSMTLPIGGADMPVVISLYNALTGLAVAFEGFVLNRSSARSGVDGHRGQQHHGPHHVLADLADRVLGARARP